jgi:hypothetical protein
MASALATLSAGLVSITAAVFARRNPAGSLAGVFA